MGKVTYFKKWKETDAKLEAEGEPTGWFEVDKKEVDDRLVDSYKDLDRILEYLHEGNVVNTPFSLFKSVRSR